MRDYQLFYVVAFGLGAFGAWLLDQGGHAGFAVFCMVVSVLIALGAAVKHMIVGMMQSD